MIRNIFIAVAVCAMAAKSCALMSPRSPRNADTCGARKIESGMIVQGQSFPRGSFPWLVALLHTGKRPPKFFCAGTLISKSFVISAAHCIFEKNTKDKVLAQDILALFGAHDLSDAYESARYQLTPKRVYIHDDWNSRTLGHDSDLSLLEFEEGFVHFNNFVQPICLWDSENDTTVTDGVVVGWKKSEDPTRLFDNVPKVIKTMIQTNEECFLDEGKLLDLSRSRIFCADLRNGSGVCNSISGGVLFIKIEGVFHLKGIDSSLIKDEGCDVSKNAVYTNVSKFKGWIKHIEGGADNIQSANQSDPNLATAQKMFCFFGMTKTNFRAMELGMASACVVNQTIDSEDFVLESPTNTSIEKFEAGENGQMKFLPRHIGEKLPNMIGFYASGCGLTLVRDFYFKNMQNLERLLLDRNQISTIEAKAFDDLVSVEELWLDDNKLETLDEKVFVKMVNLGQLYIQANRITCLSPTTFKIPGGKIGCVSLNLNVCINKSYYYRVTRNEFTQLEHDIRANCTGCL